MKKTIIHAVGSDCPICPKCGNWNALLDGVIFDHKNNQRIEYLECRDCGYRVIYGDYEIVAIRQDVENREFVGTASDGTEVTLGEFDNPGSLMRYLKDHPTPDTW